MGGVGVFMVNDIVWELKMKTDSHGNIGKKNSY